MSKEFNIEFDDALLELKGWKNPRYDGSKLQAAQINKFTPGDKSFGKQPVIQRKTNAIYIANTIRDAYADPEVDPDPNNKYTRIKNHSYIGIEKILLINDDDDSITVLDGKGVGEDIIGNVNFLGFNRFLTSDFPTGGKFRIKVLDESIQTNLKPEGYFVKMNKGYLYPAFRFNFVFDAHDGTGVGGNHDPRNGMYFYTDGEKDPFFIATGSTNLQGNETIIQSGSLRFRYANFFGGQNTQFNMLLSTPSFASSSIHNNPFTRQYYSGSFGFVNNREADGSTNAEKYGKSGLGSSSKFLGIDTLNFLRDTTANPNIPIQDKTELHITFFEGTKDFAPGKNDERSISTFEIDSNQDALNLGDECNDGLPTIHEFVLNGEYDHRFTPSTLTHNDEIQTAYFVEGDPAINNAGNLNSTTGCHNNPAIERVDTMNVFVQGGNEGSHGVIGIDTPTNPNATLITNFTKENDYSGSFNYEISFLRKDHVIIADLEKPFELPQGIGTKGVALIPQELDNSILTNLDYYLQEAGLLETKITKKPIRNKGFK